MNGKNNNSVKKRLLIIFAILAAAAVVCFFVCSPLTAPPGTSETAATAAPDEAIIAGQVPSEPPPAQTPPTAADGIAPDDPSPAPESPGPEPPAIEAAEITGAVTVTLSDGKSTDALLDRDYTTKHTLEADSLIAIAADEQIHSVYLIWDKPPGEWALMNTAAGSGPVLQTCGAEGFIHEYIALSAPAPEITITIPPNGAVLCDIYAFSEGYPPQWVQAWLPPLEKADMMVFPVHADDEHLYFAGILPYYAGELGYGVQVAYMTNHWNEQPRPHELLDGLWTVGVRNYPVISEFNDRYAQSLQDAQAIYGQNKIVDYYVEMLRRFRPYVAVGHDLNGEYGHGAHKLGALALKEAVEKAGSLEIHEPSYKQYGIWDTPKLYLHLYSENEITMDWDVPLESFGGATAREMAVKGYDCHVSQHRWSFAVPLSGRTGSVFGLVRTLVGPDIKGGDMFENINIS